MIVSDDVVAMVRAGIAGGLSWSEIGRRIGRSKCAVAGIIRRHIYGKANGYRNPALAHTPPRDYTQRKKLGTASRATLPVPAPLPLPVLPPVPPPTKCAWPLNDGMPWRFCEAPAEPGYSYCTAHCRMSYVNWRRLLAA